MPPLVDDYKWIVLTIAQEASSQSFDGKVGVAEVIRNRMITRYNSDGTGLGTVLAPYQFSGWNSKDPNRVRVGRLDKDSKVIKDCIAAWLKASISRSNLTQGANLYHAISMDPYPSWVYSPKVTMTTQIGDHIFYKEER